MSEGYQPLSVEHFAYIGERTTQEDEFLRRLKAAADEAGIRRIWIAPEQAAFMQILLKATGAKQVVEVGTLVGYSAICMARALPPDGHVRTIEISEKHAAFAKDWIARSDVADRVSVLQGNAVDFLPKMESGSADAAFLDADKDNYPAYLRECLRIVRRGGLILIDNALAFGELLAEKPTRDDVETMRAFNDLMAATDALQSIIVPLGDGLWVGVVR